MKTIDTENHIYVEPSRRILKIFDMNPFYFSEGYQLLMEMLHELNDAVLNIKTCDDLFISENVIKLIDMLDTLMGWIDLYPPEEAMNQRYGNKSFRKWHEHLVKEIDIIVTNILPEELKPASIELCAYLLDSFGNSTRIDYGSGHESSFVVFLLCLYRIGFLTNADHQAVVLRVFVKYLYLCRSLQTKYKMEPAGSHGVHSIDDFQFVPFLWGSAQLANNKSLIPDSYLKQSTVEANAHKYLFFDCVNFINQTKSGPFYQHSNQLWNISAVPTWTKVNSGLFKMYEGEVLKKFPVVQHFRFGSLFPFEKRSDTSAVQGEPATMEFVEERVPNTVIHLPKIEE
ncbi:phosphotyrosyl phosphate activator protein [Dictyocaulus viviparus]|uniref:Serine/threonine-protein phosphatase 2A activator n=1 Tax=Dictyocaulus viviparus TaxID=29172 RepID=A0A0D8Y8V3_DICVI|nr:phosphotyrosyl phosphate activator protein [Dictyocaulus viviparus]